ncbi:MAG: hypothetical protein ACYDCK_09955 [Thermoplasmatota archaeon]
MTLLEVVRLVAAVVFLFPFTGVLLASAIFPRRRIAADYAGVLFVFTALALALVADVLVGLALGFLGAFNTRSVFVVFVILDAAAAAVAWRRGAWTRGGAVEHAPDPPRAAHLDALVLARREEDEARRAGDPRRADAARARAEAGEESARDELYG